MNQIPEKINNFNLYKNGDNKLVGITGEVALPDFESMTETMSGTGMLGEIDSPTPGQYGSMELEIPYRVLTEDAFEMLDPTQLIDITMRASEQVTTGTGTLDFKSMRVVTRGRSKKLTPGTVKIGGAMESKIVMEIFYIMIEINDRQMVELDKLNGIFKVNGKDVLEKVRAQC